MTFRWFLSGITAESLIVRHVADPDSLQQEVAPFPFEERWRFEQWLSLDAEPFEARSLLESLYREISCLHDPRTLSMQQLTREIGRAFESGAITLDVQRGVGAVNAPAAGEVQPALPDEPPTAPARRVQEQETFIEIILEYDDGAPVEGQPYQLVDAKGVRHDGKTGKGGFVRIEPLPKGECKLTFPDLDGREWRAA